MTTKVSMAILTRGERERKRREIISRDMLGRPRDGNYIMDSLARCNNDELETQVGVEKYLPCQLTR